jgi:cation transport ATPase
MITGDSQAVADSVARLLGIDEVPAQVLPADKAAAVKRFQEGGRKVAMVGDGVRRTCPVTRVARGGDFDDRPANDRTE